MAQLMVKKGLKNQDTVAQLSPVCADEIVSLIYEGPLEAKPWHSFLKHLRERADCDFAALTLRSWKRGGSTLTIRVGRTPEMVALAEKLSHEHAGLSPQDPLLNALQKPGDIYTLDEVISPAELRASEFYTKVIKPRGIEHQIGMRFGEPGGCEANIGLINNAGAKPFGPLERAFLLSCRPHLERALALFSGIKQNLAEKAIFQETLDRLTIGVVLFNGAGAVIDCNEAAHRFIGEDKPFNIRRSKLGTENSNDNTRLQLALQRATASLGNEAETFIDAFQVTAPSGHTVGVLVRRHVIDDPYYSDVSPRVITYITDSRQQVVAPDKFVSQLFGLTNSEAQLANLLSQGYTLQEAAEFLSLTENTVRTYAKQILAKAGVRRQTDLVRLILKSVALLA